MQEWKVSPEESGTKLLSFLKMKLGENVSARQLKRAVDAGNCRLNGKVERFASNLVGRGDLVSFEMFTIPTVSHSALLGGSERFLFVDNDIVAYNKPAGIISEDKALLAFVQRSYPGATLLHRLDRETTGILLFARNIEATRAILSLFKNREVEKTYLALVDGIPKSISGKIENFMGKLHSYQGQTIWGEVAKDKGLLATTAWRLDRAGKQASLLKCCPKTGRTHQIRVHLSGLGHPILGDHQYGRSFHCSYHPKRLLLHAAEIAFEHPATGKRIAIKAPLPEDFNEAILRLLPPS